MKNLLTYLETFHSTKGSSYCKKKKKVFQSWKWRLKRVFIYLFYYF